MPDLSFNTDAGKTIAREMLVVYLNTGTSAAPVWSAVGKRVEDSSTEIDWDTETVRDILGAVYSTMKKPTIKQSFEPCNLDAGDAAQVKLWNVAIKDQDGLCHEEVATDRRQMDTNNSAGAWSPFGAHFIWR